MPVLKPFRLMMLASVVALSFVLAACGSTMLVPTPTPTPVGAGTPSVATPAAQLTGLAGQGFQLFQQYKCTECHSLSGDRLSGPPLNGLYGSKVSLLSGKTVVADAAYIKLSILEPDAQIVNGYKSGIMSGHIGQYESDIAKKNNLDALVAFIESQK